MTPRAEKRVRDTIVEKEMRPRKSRMTRASRRVEESLRALLLRHRPELLFTGGVEIVFHQNASTMISLSRKGCIGTLRVHRLFHSAPEHVLEAIVRSFFTQVSRGTARKLRARILDFVEKKRQVTISAAPLPRTRPPRGDVYDLVDIQNGVVRRYIPERLNREPLKVAWSMRVTPSLMGKWIETPQRTPNLIVINRLLDDTRVPRFYVEYIVYHEVLHDLFPIHRQDGRWVHHSAEFRRRERLFPRYRDARSWEEKQLPKLIERHGC